MKPGTKKIVLAACLLMGIGVVLMAAAFAGGARFEDLNYEMTIGKGRLRRNLFNIIYNINGILSDDWYDRDDWDEAFDDISEAKNELKEAAHELKKTMRLFTDEYADKDVKSINIDVSAADINIETGTSLALNIRQAKHRSVYGSLNNGVLGITERYGSRRLKKHNPAYVTLTVPENTDLEELDISLNAGALDMKHSSLSVKELSLELNAGSVSIKGITSSSTDIDCTAGSMHIAGSLRGLTDVDCTAGKITLKIDSAGENYSWNTHAAAGSIHVNDSFASGFTSAGNNSKHKKENHLELSATAGSIDVAIR